MPVLKADWLTVKSAAIEVKLWLSFAADTCRLIWESATLKTKFYTKEWLAYNKVCRC